jgi:hypothetical protein
MAVRSHENLTLRTLDEPGSDPVERLASRKHGAEACGGRDVAAWSEIGKALCNSVPHTLTGIRFLTNLLITVPAIRPVRRCRFPEAAQLRCVVRWRLATPATGRRFPA